VKYEARALTTPTAATTLTRRPIPQAGSWTRRIAAISPASISGNAKKKIPVPLSLDANGTTSTSQGVGLPKVYPGGGEPGEYTLEEVGADRRCGPGDVKRVPIGPLAT